MKIAPTWLNDEALQKVMTALNEYAPTYCVGGCVRDAVIGRDANDIDLATSLTPSKVREVLKTVRGVRLLPTGIKHGTWTAMVGEKAFEITTFRQDTTTNGRHAEVEFSESMEVDAARRDFTMNALYMDIEGNVYDPVGTGIDDAVNRRVKFVGNADDRCMEDYLRILRLFRFHAQLGSDDNIGSAEMAAAERHAASIVRNVSGERVWSELKKLLSAKNPVPTLDEMDESGVLEALFGKISVSPSRVHCLMYAEPMLGLAPSWERRYIALTNGARPPFPCSAQEDAHIFSVKSLLEKNVPIKVAAYMLKDRFKAQDYAVLYISKHDLEFGRLYREDVEFGLEEAKTKSPPIPASVFIAMGVPIGRSVGECVREAERIFTDLLLMPNQDRILEKMKDFISVRIVIDESS